MRGHRRRTGRKHPQISAPAPPPPPTKKSPIGAEEEAADGGHAADEEDVDHNTRACDPFAGDTLFALPLPSSCAPRRRQRRYQK